MPALRISRKGSTSRSKFSTLSLCGPRHHPLKEAPPERGAAAAFGAVLLGPHKAPLVPPAIHAAQHERAGRARRACWLLIAAGCTRPTLPPVSRGRKTSGHGYLTRSCPRDSVNFIHFGVIPIPHKPVAKCHEGEISPSRFSRYSRPAMEAARGVGPGARISHPAHAQGGPGMAVIKASRARDHAQLLELRRKGAKQPRRSGSRASRWAGAILPISRIGMKKGPDAKPGPVVTRYVDGRRGGAYLAPYILPRVKGCLPRGLSGRCPCPLRWTQGLILGSVGSASRRSGAALPWTVLCNAREQLNTHSPVDGKAEGALVSLDRCHKAWT